MVCAINLLESDLSLSECLFEHCCQQRSSINALCTTCTEIRRNDHPASRMSTIRILLNGSSWIKGAHVHLRSVTPVCNALTILTLNLIAITQLKHRRCFGVNATAWQDGRRLWIFHQNIYYLLACICCTQMKLTSSFILVILFSVSAYTSAALLSQHNKYLFWK